MGWGVVEVEAAECGFDLKKERKDSARLSERDWGRGLSGVVEAEGREGEEGGGGDDAGGVEVVAVV